MKLPKKWWEVYPQGTKEGDEESAFFLAIERHPTYVFRSIAMIAKESKLSVERVEEIISKYAKYKIVVPHPKPKNESNWGYWERVIVEFPELFQSNNTLAQKDHDKRIKGN